MTSGPPARIDRAALERILQRAAELQASEHEGSHLSPDEILSLGKEVGIPQRHLQQVGQSQQHFTARLRASGLQKAQVFGGDVGFHCKVQLAHAPTLAPVTQQVTHRRCRRHGLGSPRGCTSDHRSLGYSPKAARAPLPRR